jgi:hypothetical protein
MNDVQILQIVDRFKLGSHNPENFLSELQNAAIVVLRHFDIDPIEVFQNILDKCLAATRRGDANDPIHLYFQDWFATYDAVRVGDWTDNTSPNSIERRSRIKELLKIDPSRDSDLEFLFPLYLEPNVIIVNKQRPWLTPERIRTDGYYGPSILEYLKRSGFAPQNIAMVNQATSEILDKLGDPRSNEKFAARGLVIGYVQSGKTTNINLLIGKAIDSGYRMVIVLAGLTDVLRNQTQRRIDKELIGKKIIEIDPDELRGDGYIGKSDWDQFNEHPPPSGNQAVIPIERMTTRKIDFSPGQGINAFTDDWAVNGSSARIVVIKKQKQRLESLISELQIMSQSVREDLPVLVIDDESDQATVNTVNPEKPKKKELEDRSAINKCIVDLLSAFGNRSGRCQYVGYTATPFANVLINPDDASDLFPQDFIVALSRPPGYMGVRDFHDLDDEFMPVYGLDPLLSNKEKHVRDVNPDDGENELNKSLQKALDSFVISGALKLYRRQTLGLPFRHHTMFFTDSTMTSRMDDARDDILRIWRGSSYNTSIGMKRLEILYGSDFLKFSEKRNDPSYFPMTFEDLRPHIAKAIQKINSTWNDHGTLLIINQNTNEQTPDFEVEEIWKIIVGGTKLSRGYTIEGLTTTFFRRKSTGEDTLLQMGRWFGYRNEYRDLVRLFISRSEAISRKKKLDVYKAFEASCRDEETFRLELLRYTRVIPGVEPIRPRDIVPLVQCTHPDLKPAQSNKIWNAQLTARNYGGRRRAFGKTSINIDFRQRNAELLRSLLSEFPLQHGFLREGMKGPFQYSLVPHQRVSDLLHAMAIGKPANQDEKLFLDYLNDSRNEITDWLVLLPQISERADNPTWEINEANTSSTILRTWEGEPETEEGNFTTLADDLMRKPAYFISGINPDTKPNQLSSLVVDLKKERNRAVLLALLIHIMNSPDDGFEAFTEDSPAIGFEYFLPKNKMPFFGYEAKRRLVGDPIVIDANELEQERVV